MIRITGEIPRQVAVAVSGGIDSMAVLDFLRRKHDVLVLHYNHGTPYAPKAEQLVRDYCEEHGVQVIVGTNTEEMPAGVGVVMPPGAHQVENIGDDDFEVLFLEVTGPGGATPESRSQPLVGVGV